MRIFWFLILKMQIFYNVNWLLFLGTDVKNYMMYPLIYSSPGEKKPISITLHMNVSMWITKYTYLSTQVSEFAGFSVKNVFCWQTDGVWV